MKSLSIASFFLAVTAQLTASSPALDRPILLRTYSELADVDARLEQELTSDECGAWHLGCTEIEVFAFRRLLPEPTKEEKEQLVVRGLSGRTPRQVIVDGCALLATRLRWTIDNLRLSPKDEMTAHKIADCEMELRIASAIIREYAKEANSPKPMPMAITPPAAQEARRP